MSKRPKLIPISPKARVVASTFSGVGGGIDIVDEELEVRIAYYLLDNPAPSDLEFHSFAAGLGLSKERVEAVAYRMLSTVVGTANQWDLLSRDAKEMDSMLYQLGVDVDEVIHALRDVNPSLSINLANLMIRLTNMEGISRLTRMRNRTLSSTQPDSYDPDIEDMLDRTDGIRQSDPNLQRRTGDVSLVTDQSRVDHVNGELAKIGIDQRRIDAACQLLNLDSMADLSKEVLSSFSAMREALIRCPDSVFDDPAFEELRTTFPKINDRNGGDQLRYAAARGSFRLMRDITTRYGSNFGDLFSG